MFAQPNTDFSPSYTNPPHVAFSLKSLDIKKASGLDKIPPKLLKAASIDKKLIIKTKSRTISLYMW